MRILDASALLAYLLDEAGAGEVEQALGDGAAIGAVNLAEVLAKLSDAGEDPDSAMGGITVLPLDVVPVDEDLAVESARLRPLSMSMGLSLGDRACLALGRRLGVRVLTADGAWVGLIPGLDVVAIR